MAGKAEREAVLAGKTERDAAMKARLARDEVIRQDRVEGFCVAIPMMPNDSFDDVAIAVAHTLDEKEVTAQRDYANSEYVFKLNSESQVSRLVAVGLMLHDGHRAVRDFR